MPVFEHRLIFEVARGLTAFLNLEAGLTRGGAYTASRVSAKEAPPIFFIVGMSRSGTTWLMRLLNQHPEILCKGEGRFFGKDWREPGMMEPNIRKQPSSLQNALARSEYLRLWVERSVWSRRDEPEEHLRNLTRLSVNYFLAHELAKTGKKMVGDKTPLLKTGIAREISETLPGAKVIHIVRDGRDRAVSLMHYLWNNARSDGGLYAVRPEELKKRDAYREDPRPFGEHGQSIFTEKRIGRMASDWDVKVGEIIREGPELLGGDYAEVRYEDLLESPENEARRLLKFLGADSRRKTVERCVERVSFERRSKGRRKGEEDPTSVSLRKGISGDWKSVFTGMDRRVFKEAAGDTLVRAGYERDSNW